MANASAIYDDDDDDKEDEDNEKRNQHTEKIEVNNDIINTTNNFILIHVFKAIQTYGSKIRKNTIIKSSNVFQSKLDKVVDVSWRMECFGNSSEENYDKTTEENGNNDNKVSYLVSLLLITPSGDTKTYKFRCGYMVLKEIVSKLKDARQQLANQLS